MVLADNFPNDLLIHCMNEAYLILIAMIKKASSWRNWENLPISSVWHLVPVNSHFKRPKSTRPSLALEMGTLFMRRSRLDWARVPPRTDSRPCANSRYRLRKFVGQTHRNNDEGVPFLQNNVPKPTVFTFFKTKRY